MKLSENIEHCENCGSYIPERESRDFNGKCEECGNQETAKQKLEDMNTFVNNPILG